jgi:hypothetical protein
MNAVVVVQVEIIAVRCSSVALSVNFSIQCTASLLLWSVHRQHSGSHFVYFHDLLAVMSTLVLVVVLKKTAKLSKNIYTLQVVEHVRYLEHPGLQAYQDLLNSLALWHYSVVVCYKHTGSGSSNSSTARRGQCTSVVLDAGCDTAMATKCTLTQACQSTGCCLLIACGC